MIQSDKGNCNHIAVETLFEVCRYFEKCGFRFLIYGGWGLDILFGQKTRPHKDIDLFFWRQDYGLLLDAIQFAGWKAFELPDIHVAIKEPFKADIVFFDDPHADPVIGNTSAFRVEIPRRGFNEWTFGSIDGRPLPVGCREMVLKMYTDSKRQEKASDVALVKRLVADSDPTLMADILWTYIGYDRLSRWLPIA
jgi:hypothetical protein